MVKNIIKNLRFLLKPRNIALIGATWLASSLPNSSFGNVQERVQLGLAALKQLESNNLTAGQKAELYTIAENEFAGALKEDPTNCNALTGYGRFQIKSGQFKRAIPNLEKAVKHCDRGNALEFLISAYVNVRDFENAKKNIDVMLMKDKNPAYAFAQLGLIHWLKKEYKASIVECEKSVAIDPRRFRTYNNMAAAYEKLGDLENAMKFVKQAITINPNYASGHFELGIIYRKMGKLNEAVTAFGKSVELNPNADNFRDELKITETMLK